MGPAEIVRYARGGAPVVWWPAEESPKDDGVYKSNTQPLFRSLRWDACLGDLIPAKEMQSAFQKEQASWLRVKEFAITNAAWVIAARLTNAMPVTDIHWWGSMQSRSFLGASSGYT